MEMKRRSVKRMMPSFGRDEQLSGSKSQDGLLLKDKVVQLM